MKSIVHNLLSNGIKYQKEGGGPRIEIKTYKENGIPVLEVKDNGIGIDMKVHGRKLFDLFSRFHSKYTGSGIGLHIINSVIQLQGGRIEVYSEVDNGTTFTCYLSDVVVE